MRGGGTWWSSGDRVYFRDESTGIVAAAFVGRSPKFAEILAWERCRSMIANERFNAAMAGQRRMPGGGVWRRKRP